MSKIIGIIISVLVLGGAFFLFTNNSNDTSDTAEIAMEMEKAETVVANSESMEKTNPVDDEMDNSTMKPTENAEMFEIAEGSEVSYTAQKRFLTKEDAVVVGVTTEVSGSGWVDLEESKGFLEAEFDLTDLVSDSSKRDADIIPMFADTEVMYFANITNLDNLEKNTAFSIVVPSEVTINNVTNTVDFDVNGIVGDNGIDATGTATIKLSDFGINPPSLVGIYSVDDEIELAFDIKGQSVENIMMEEEEGSLE